MTYEPPIRRRPPDRVKLLREIADELNALAVRLELRAATVDDCRRLRITAAELRGRADEAERLDRREVKR